jgi:hypothetical protein
MKNSSSREKKCTVSSAENLAQPSAATKAPVAAYAKRTNVSCQKNKMLQVCSAEVAEKTIMDQSLQVTWG